MTWKQENNFRNGFLASINIHIVVLHVDIVLVEPKVSHYLFQMTGFSGHIGFCAYRPPGDYPSLFAVDFENLMPIPNAMPNCKNLSPSAQFLWIPSQLVWGSTCANGRAGLLFLPTARTMMSSIYLYIEMLTDKLILYMHQRRVIYSRTMSPQHYIKGGQVVFEGEEQLLLWMIHTSQVLIAMQI